VGLLRLLLALAVFNAHAGCIAVKLGSYWLSPFIAVRSFYLISGFYMAMVIANTYSKIPNGARLFYMNRAVRLFPAYIVVLAGAAALQLTGHFDTPIEYLWTGSKAYSGSASWGYALTSFINDLLLVPAPIQLMVYGSSLRPPLSTEMLILPAYTVGVEMLFYALAPFIVMRSWRFLTTLFVASFGLHIAPAVMGLPWRPFQYDFFPGVLVFFIAGVIVYRLSGPVASRLKRVKWNTLP
jgi:peptidoglycan/LPS O-acetylase OafA/YrhL